MKQQYAVKISKQGQLTLPSKLRENLELVEGSYVLLSVASDNKTIRINDPPAISKHFGKLANAWTNNKQDAVDASKATRSAMQPRAFQ